MDFYDHPAFVHDLFDAIADYNIAQVREALKYDIDAVYFGDDWGQQRGLQMGYELWKEVHISGAGTHVRGRRGGGQARVYPLVWRRG